MPHSLRVGSQGLRTTASKKELQKVITDMAEAHDQLHSAHAEILAKNAADGRVPPAGEDDTAKGGSAQTVRQASSHLTTCESPKASDLAEAIREHYSRRDQKNLAANKSTDRAARLAEAMQPPPVTK